MENEPTKKEYAFLKAYLRYKLKMDPNARRFIKDGTINMNGRPYYQYFFFEPKKSARSEDLSNQVMLQSSSVDEVYILPEKPGIRIRVSFIKDKKPRGFDNYLKKFEGKYGRLLTYKDCQINPKDLE